MPVNFNITNQLASPAIYASSFATRPAPSFVGRLFVDTDNPSTGIYRDTSTVWVAVAGTSVGEIQSLNDVCVVGNSTTTLGIEIFGQSAYGENPIAPFGQIPPEGNYALTIGNYSEFESSIYTTGNNFFSGASVNTIIQGKLKIGNNISPAVSLDLVGQQKILNETLTCLLFDHNTEDWANQIVFAETGTIWANITANKNENEFQIFAPKFFVGGMSSTNFFRLSNDSAVFNNTTNTILFGINIEPSVALDVVGDVKFISLQNFATNAAAIAGGLSLGNLFFTNTGGQATLKIVI